MIYTYYKDDPMSPDVKTVFDWTQEFLEPFKSRLGGSGDTMWIAGGAVRDQFTGNTPADYDLFFSEERHLRNVSDLMESLGIAKPVKNARTVAHQQVPEVKYAIDFVSDDGTKYQLIDRAYYPNLETLLGSFDYTVAMAGAGFGHISYHFDFLDDLANKRLRYNTLQSPHSALIRLEQYARKGFRLDSEERQRLIDHIVLHDYINPCEEIWSEQ